MADPRNVRAQLAEKLGALRPMMESMQLADRIEVFHEFVQHSSSSRQLIIDAAQVLSKLPRSDPSFPAAAFTIASALSTIGDLEQAEKLLIDARGKAGGAAERALAAYNLFHIRLRMGKQEDALDMLMNAVRQNPGAFAFHDAEKYPLSRILGAGGMGCTFLCENVSGGRPVAVKTLWQPHQGAGDTVFADVQRLQQIQSDVIMIPKEFAYADPAQQLHPYFVYERITGAVTLDQWVEKNGLMPLDMARKVGAKILEALHAAHSVGVCHLDLKPSNILFKGLGTNVEVKITDFGLFRAGTSLRQHFIANPGLTPRTEFSKRIADTLELVAPELKGNVQAGQPGVQSDFYALGSIIYKYLTGQSLEVILQKHLPDLPGLVDIFLACREESVSRRPVEAGRLAQWWADPSLGPEVAVPAAIQKAQEFEAEQQARLAAAEEAEKKKGKLPLIIGIAVVVLIAGGLGLFFGLRGKKEAGGKSKAKVEKQKPAITEGELTAMQTWYKKAREQIRHFLAGNCEPAHKAGYKYQSRLVAVKKSQMVRGKVRDYTEFQLQIKPDPSGSASGEMDIFACPGRIADIHKDHQIVIKIRVRYYQASMFSRGQRLGRLEIQGKLINYLDKRVYSSGVAQKRGTFFLPRLRKVSDPGIAAFGRPKRAKVGDKTLQIANLTFYRQGEGTSVVGSWKCTLKTDQFQRVIDDWATGCKNLEATLRRLDEPDPKHKKLTELWRESHTWAVGFCAALADLRKGISPYDESMVNKAVNALSNSRKEWNKKILDRYKDLADDLDVKVTDKGF